MAQVVDVFYKAGGRASAINEAAKKRSSWLDPDLVDAFLQIANGPKSNEFWSGLESDNILSLIQGIEPHSFTVELSEDQLDNIAEAFADVVDTKSHFTSGHSSRVAKYTRTIAKTLGFSAERCRWLYRAGLLHDIGKLGVSNAILDKPGKLTEDEWKEVRLHPKYTEEILSRLAPFSELAVVAGAHHERLDGKGYHQG